MEKWNPKNLEKVELDKDLEEELDQIQLPENLDGNSNKRALEEIEVMSIGTFATAAYRVSSKKVYNDNRMDISKEESTWGPESSLVLN